MKVGDLVMLSPELGGSIREIGIIVEICRGSFARIGYKHCNERARIMWNQPLFTGGTTKFSYETFDALVDVNQ